MLGPNRLKKAASDFGKVGPQAGSATFAAVLLPLALSCYGQPASFPPSPNAPPPSVAARPEYKLDRSEEDWSLLRDPALHADPWDRFKYLSLGRNGWYMTLGGEIRTFYEFYRNYNWGTGPQDGNGYYLQRLMSSADLRFGNRARVFFEIRSGVEAGRNGGPRPSQDRDTFDVSQVFAGFTAIRGKDKPLLELKIGRQELNYGEGSLLAIRELNVRRTFDGVKAIVRPGGWQVDLLAFRPALIRTGAFDDGFDSSQALWGAWAAKPIKNRSFWRQVDLYYLGLDRKQAQFEEGTARERRHTLGVLFRGQQGAFSTFAEADFQFGRFGDGNIKAWKYAQSLSWSFPSRRFQPVASLLGAISSGDSNSTTARLQTFNPLFPRGLYYGYIDSNGSPNAIVIHPEVSLTVSPAVSVTVRHFSFWRQSTSDGVYSQPGFLLRSTSENSARYVGSLQDLAVRWRADRHTTVEALATYYEVGAFLRGLSPPGRNLFYVSLKISYRF